MNEMAGARAPTWFRVVAVLAVPWNLFGVWQYLSYVGVVPMMREMTADETAILAGAPVWYAAAFAIAVFAGILGALGLVLGRAGSRPLLIISLVALVVQFGWWCFMSGAAERLGSATYAAPVMIVLVGVLLVWMAGTGIRRGWLR